MRENYFEDGKWWVSPYNFVPEVRTELNLPQSVQIHDATLREMALTKPTNIHALGRISGVGARKLEAYGEDFLSVIAQF